MKRRLSLLGSTGSIGRSALDVVSRHPERFEVVGLAAGRDMEALAQQIKAFRPKIVSTADDESLKKLQNLISLNGIEAGSGATSLEAVARFPNADLVISAVVGAAGLRPTFAAVDAGKTVALANKESLVVAGKLVTERSRERGATIIPVDSEHSALFQSLQGHRRQDVTRLLLTASGGPFRKKNKEELAHVTVAQALAHPNWSMGNKITIDSATMMNKGLEVIEASWLFDISPTKIEVVIHPESIIHSMVEYCDGSVLAQLGVPDMRTPLAYAMAYPERVPSGVEQLDLTKHGALHFERVDRERFPSLGLAFDAIAEGGSLPCILNAANEVAVAAFLNEHIGFLEIPQIVRKTMERLETKSFATIDEILEIDRRARDVASTFMP